MNECHYWWFRRSSGLQSALRRNVHVDPDDVLVHELEGVRDVLQRRYRVATTLGIGPRYLHSTGQLHKGGPNTGVFLQLPPKGGEDIPIPGERFSFANLMSAQAAGDLQALLERGRRAGRVTLADVRQVTRVASTEHDHALAAGTS